MPRSLRRCRVTPAEQAIKDGGYFSRCGKGCDACPLPSLRGPIVRPEGGVAVTQGLHCHAQGGCDACASAVSPFLFDRLAAAPRHVWCQGGVRDELLLAGEAAQIGAVFGGGSLPPFPPRSHRFVWHRHPIRYSACRFGSCPRFLIIRALLALFSGGAFFPPSPSCSISPIFRRISCSYAPIRSSIPSYIFNAWHKLNKWSSRQCPVNCSAISSALLRQCGSRNCASFRASRSPSAMARIIAIPVVH